MTAFDTPRSWTTARPESAGYSTPDLSASRRIRIQVTRTRIIETKTVPLAAGSSRARSADQPSAFARSRWLAAMKDAAGLAVLMAGGYLCFLAA